MKLRPLRTTTNSGSASKAIKYVALFAFVGVAAFGVFFLTNQLQDQQAPDESFAALETKIVCPGDDVASIIDDGSDCDYYGGAGIQQAIEDRDLALSGTVKIKPGVYTKATSTDLENVDPSTGSVEYTAKCFATNLGKNIVIENYDMSGDVIIDGSEAQMNGFCASAGYLTVKGLTFRNFQADSNLCSTSACSEGTAILAFDDVTIDLIGNVFSNNRNSVHFDSQSSGSLNLKSNIIYNSRGEGVWVEGDISLDLINNTILYSRANGVKIEMVSGTYNLINNIVIRNTLAGLSARGGSGISNYNVVWENGTNYSGVAIGANDIQSDPMLNESGDIDFSLRSGSPAIDAGDPSTAKDVDGTRADIGAYGGSESCYLDSSSRFCSDLRDTVSQTRPPVTGTATSTTTSTSTGTLTEIPTSDGYEPLYPYTSNVGGKPCDGASGAGCEFMARTVKDNGDGTETEQIIAYGKVFNFDISNAFRPWDINGRLLHTFSKYDSSFCALASQPEKCRLDTRTIRPASGSQVWQEQITAYGKFWVFDEGRTLTNSGNLLDVPRYNYTQAANGYDGPCTLKPAADKYCVFNARTFRILPNGHRVEQIQAYGRHWNFDIDNSFSDFGHGVTSDIDRYRNGTGPCTFRQSGEDCTFDTRTMRHIPGGDVIEQIIAYGRLWNYNIDDGYSIVFNSDARLLTSVERYGGSILPTTTATVVSTVTNTGTATSTSTVTATSTGTAVPTTVDLDSPTGLSQSCGNSGAESTFSWNPVTGAAAYIVRINKDGEFTGHNPAQGDFFVLVPSGTEILISNLSANQGYNSWSVQPLVSSDNDPDNIALTYSATANGGSFQCVPVSPDIPIVNSGYQTITFLDSIAITGTKLAGHGIMVNGNEVIPPGEAVQWSYAIPLTIGTNEVNVTSTDSGVESDPVRVVIDRCLFGDVNCDGIVNIADFAKFIKAFRIQISIENGLTAERFPFMDLADMDRGPSQNGNGSNDVGDFANFKNEYLRYN